MRKGEGRLTQSLDKGYGHGRGLNYGAACVCLCLIYGLSPAAPRPVPSRLDCDVTGTSLCPTCRIILHISVGRFSSGCHVERLQLQLRLAGLRNMPGQILQLLPLLLLPRVAAAVDNL